MTRQFSALAYVIRVALIIRQCHTNHSMETNCWSKYYAKLVDVYTICGVSRCPWC